MSFREITQLRKEGHLQEALEMAIKEIQTGRDEWKLNALFWVYRDLCKQSISTGNLQEAHQWLAKAEKIYEEMDDNEYADDALLFLKKAISPKYQLVKQAGELSKEGKTKEAYLQVKAIKEKEGLETNMHEDYGWIIFRYLRNHFTEIGSLESRKTLFEYLQLSNPRPSLLHSQILLLTTQISERYPDLKFIPFLKLWGTGNFREEDFKETTSNGVNYAPLVTRIIDRCFKMHYPLKEIAEAFDGIAYVTEERLLFLYSRHFFFELWNNKEAPKDVFSTLTKLYLDGTEDKMGPNPYHSKILQIICWRQKIRQDISFKKIFEKWGMQRLMENDWTRTPSEKGDITYPSLAEKAIKYYKEALENAGGLCKADEHFERLIETAMAKYPDDSQYLRLYGQFLQEHNQREKAIDIYKKLVLHVNKFYVWDELAQLLDDNRLKLAAWCKALSCGDKEEFIGKIHLHLAKLLADEKRYAEAEAELQKVAKTYEIKGWEKPSTYYMVESMVRLAGPAVDAHPLDYASQSSEIEEYVYGEFEYRPMCVTKIIKDKKRKRIIIHDSEGFSAAVNPRNFAALTNVHTGQVVDVKIADDKPLMIRKSEQKDWSIFRKRYGVIDYINRDKSVYHIKDTDSKILYYRFQQQQFSKGDLVEFRTYRNVYKGRETTEVADIKKADKNPISE